MARYLKEHLSFTQAGLEILSEEAHDGSGKTLKLKGVCIEGGGTGPLGCGHADDVETAQHGLDPADRQPHGSEHGKGPAASLIKCHSVARTMSDQEGAVVNGQRDECHGAAHEQPGGHRHESPVR